MSHLICSNIRFNWRFNFGMLFDVNNSNDLVGILIFSSTDCRTNTDYKIGPTASGTLPRWVRRKRQVL